MKRRSKDARAGKPERGVVRSMRMAGKGDFKRDFKRDFKN
jgi:hypothetical protein